jgi:hypothetical protein
MSAATKTPDDERASGAGASEEYRIANLEREIARLTWRERNPMAALQKLPTNEGRERERRDMARIARLNQEAAERVQRERVQAERDAPKREGLEAALRTADEQMTRERVEHDRRMTALVAARHDLNVAVGAFELRARAAGVQKPLPPAPKWKAPR